MKSPKLLRSEIHALRGRVEKIRDVLIRKVQNTNEPAWGIGKDCARAAELLSSLLTNQVVPENYRVAVVGRFKAGKSSFVNELLGARLAGEDTSPETAAVTTFRHGNSVKATIRFVGRESWDAIKNLHKEDAKHVDAHRVKMWESFIDKPRKNSDGKIIEVFDLPGLEKTYVKPGGHSIEILLGKSDDKTAENAFRKKLKEFTSGTRPLHCLVERIEIASPAPILDEGVLLIDTPGLDDTERFRVSLTEKAVEDVDAVLFLTKSGVAYGQSEKDFLLTLLRKGTVKQLIFVITQVDQTYDQHLRNAESNDEDPESIASRIRHEEQRIRDEIEKTLNELSGEDSPAMRRYREQLGVVGLAFTSAANHRDSKAGKHIEHRIHDDDPGGIERMKKQLLHLLSTESRLALVAHNIAGGTKSALEELLTIVANRRAALRDIKDGEVAEQRLATFRVEFESARERFQIAAVEQVTVLKQNLDARRKQNNHIIETIGLLAERELDSFQLNDVGKHWRTRRSGSWGYMHDLQSRVANRIFPKVQQILSEMTEQFATFVGLFEKHLATLSHSSEDIASNLDLGANLPFDLTKILMGSLDKSLKAANDLITDEEQRIVSFLDDFVSEEVENKISAARESVSDIFGRGTTYQQSLEVRAFYTEVKRLLQEALTAHLAVRSGAFGDFLMVEAEGVPRNALGEVQATLANAEQDIRAAATAKIGGQREAFEQESNLLSAEVLTVVEACAPLLGEIAEPVAIAVQPNVSLPKSSSPVQSVEEVEASSGEWFDEIQNRATETLTRLRLNDGDSGWPMEKIFAPALIGGCLRIALIDPYLAAPHQIRNLKEFLLVAAEVARPKEILVLTSNTWTEGTATNVRIMAEVGDDLFRNFGTTLTIKVDPTIHDRCVVCDHGVLFKLGRGLDIYKPATGLASHRPASRRVRRTEIDVFSIPGFVNGGKVIG
jgi:predicted GTPase